MGEDVPPIKPFEIYSIYDRRCWGNFLLEKEELLGRMKDC